MTAYRLTPDSPRRITSWEHEQVFVEMYGCVPLRHEVHHVNGDGLDNRPENLMLLQVHDHKRLHAGWVFSIRGWEKPCRGCGRILPATTQYFYGRWRQRAGRTSLWDLCKPCASARQQERYAKPHAA